MQPVRDPRGFIVFLGLFFTTSYCYESLNTIVIFPNEEMAKYIRTPPPLVFNLKPIFVSHAPELLKSHQYQFLGPYFIPRNTFMHVNRPQSTSIPLLAHSHGSVRVPAGPAKKPTTTRTRTRNDPYPGPAVGYPTRGDH